MRDSGKPEIGAKQFEGKRLIQGENYRNWPRRRKGHMGTASIKRDEFPKFDTFKCKLSHYPFFFLSS